MFASSGTFILFNSPSLGNELIANIAEVVVVKGTISGPDLANLKAYSIAKWGL
jgi:hypothetical protein